ncbi:hypothetical protein PTKIN_Ptkin08bG0028100 [Pterospermum kingtungense]
MSLSSSSILNLKSKRQPPLYVTLSKRHRFWSPTPLCSPPNRNEYSDFPKVLSKKLFGYFGAIQPRGGWWKLRDIEAPKSSAAAKPVTVWIAVKRMWSLVGDDKWIVFLALGALIIAAVSEISMPRVLTASIFSANSGESAAFFRSSRMLILLLIISGICSGLRSGCFAIANTILVKRLRQSLYSSLLFQDVSFFDMETVGNLTSRLGADCQRLSYVIGNDIHLIIRNVIQGTGALINLLTLSWPLTLPTLIVCSILAVLFSIYGQYQMRAAKLMQEFNACANNVAQETLSLMRTVRAYGTEGEELGRYKQWLDELAFVSIRESAAYGLWSMSFLTLYRATQIIAVLFGGMCVMNSHVSPEQLTKYILYCEWLIYATWRVVDNSSSLLQSIGACEKVFQLMDLLPADQFLSHGKSEATEINGEYTVRKCVFSLSFKDNKNILPPLLNFLIFDLQVPILDQLNLSVQANEIVAIVGLSGSGKSTLVNLMLRLYEPVDGQIYIDGLPLQELDIRWLREKIGFVGQDPHLFNMDIESNIKYGCPRDVKEEDIEWAAKQAYAHEFISSLPHGYQTIVDDDLLSGGQKQRIAIARAILRDPAILVLDEATSALDAESEYYLKGVLHALRNESGTKRTFILIAHRLSTIKTVDRIVVMDGGRIVEAGSFLQFFKHFRKYGEIKDSVIMLDPRTGLPRGFGFVTYENPSVIDKVAEDTHVINGKQVDIRRTIPKGVVGTKDFKTRRILVTGIPSRLSEDEFKDLFKQFGEVKEHRIVRCNDATNYFHGFGFITFDTEQTVDDILAKGNKVELAGESQIPNHRLCQINRESNSCADHLARMGATITKDFVVFDLPPDCIKLLLFAESLEPEDNGVLLGPETNEVKPLNHAKDGKSLPQTERGASPG